MKLLLSLMVFAMSSVALAKQVTVTVQVPADATHVEFKVKDLEVDTCNKHSLEALTGWGALTGTYTLAVKSTAKGCVTPATKKVDLETFNELDDWFGQPKTIRVKFDSEQMSNVSVGFQ